MQKDGSRKTGKRIRAGMAFAGGFIGAGLISGAELMQFFGSYGLPGLLTMPLSFLLIAALSLCIMDFAAMLRTVNVGRIFCPGGSRVTEALFVLLQQILLLGANSIMLAGIGAQLQLLTGLPVRLGSLLAAMLGLLIMLAGLERIMDTFALTLPPLLAVTLVLAVLTMRSGGLSVPAGGSGVPAEFLIMGLNYACYNFFGITPVLVQFGAAIDSKRERRIAVTVGTGILLAVSGSILLALCADPKAAAEELPMAVLAGNVSPVMAAVFGLLLILGMFGSELVSGYGAAAVLTESSPLLFRRRKLCLSGIMLLCYSLSTFGFGSLIGTVYPACGFAGAVFVAAMVWRYVKKKKSL